MFKKRANRSWINLFIQINTKSQQDLFWAEIDRPSKFCGNLLSNFVFCWKNKQKNNNKQTDTGEIMTSLVEWMIVIFYFCQQISLNPSHWL